MDWLTRVPKAWSRILVPIVIVGIAAVIRTELLVTLGTRNQNVTFFPAVILAALYGGLLSGLIATVVSGLVSLFWIQHGTPDLAGWIVTAIFIGSCTLISFVCEGIRRARTTLEKANEQLRREVNEHRAAIEALHDAEATLRAAMDQSQAGIAIADAPSGQLRYVNQAGLLIRGQSEEKLVPGVDAGRYASVWQILQLDGTPFAPEEVPLARAVLHGETSSREVIVRREGNDDRYVWTNAAPILRDDGSIRAGIVVFLDVTDRKLAEEALLSNERLLTDVERVAGLGHYTLDTRSGLWRSSEVLDGIFGIGPDFVRDVAGWEELVHPADRPEMSRYLREDVIGRRERFEKEYRIVRRSDGAERWVVGYGRLEIGEGGEVLRMIGAIQDVTARKDAETRLRDSEERFKYVFENSVIGKSITMPSGEMRANGAFAGMLGYTTAELEGLRWQDVTHPDDLEESGRAIELLISGKQDKTHFVKRYLHRHGSVVWAEVWTSVRRDAAGAPCYFMTSVIDVTERRRAEETLRESRAILQAAMDQSPAGIAIADAPEGRLRYVNDAGNFILGDARNALVDGTGIAPHGSNWHAPAPDGRLLEPDELPLSRAIRFGEPGSRELVLRGPGAEARAVIASAAPIRDSSGCVTAGVVVFTDITERKQIEDELRKREEEIRSLNEELERRVSDRTAELAKSRWLLDETSHLSQVGGWEVDLQRNEMTWTDVTYEIHEIEKGVPQTVEEGINYYAPEARPRIVEAFGRAVTTGEPYDEELELITAKGRRKWVRAIGFADIEDGRVVRVHGLFQDIQAQKERVAALENANRELEAFSYSVSHDLRAPLRAIEGFSGMLGQDSSDHLTAEDQRRIDVIRKNARSMSGLIDDLLTFSRTSRSDIQRGMVKMEPLIRLAFDEVTGAPAFRESVQFRLGTLPDATGDGKLLRQVWVNLLANAVKFTKNVEAPVIEVRGTIDGDLAVYSVRDNGAGFEQKYAGKLFGVFQRLHGTKEFEGTGIGLALVKQIVEKHGGRVWAVGEVGMGATFSFSLPLFPSPRELSSASVTRA